MAAWFYAQFGDLTAPRVCERVVATAVRPRASVAVSPRGAFSRYVNAEIACKRFMYHPEARRSQAEELRPGQGCAMSELGTATV